MTRRALHLQVLRTPEFQGQNRLRQFGSINVRFVLTGARRR
jgi:hypothetical protein